MGAIMNQVKRLVWVVMIGVFVSTQRADAAAHVDFIDVGTPKSGSLVMDGWRGVIVRISLDDGLPITKVDLGDAFGLGLYGNVAERWTDAQGRSNYTETSPGPVAANNLTDSDFNFDTHFLPVENGDYQLYSLREFIGTGGPLVTARDPIPSTPFVGYGATLPERVTIREEPILLRAGGNMRSSLQLPSESPLNSVDVAYVVADGLFTVDGRINSGSQFFDILSTYDVPEPSSLLLTLMAIGAWAGRRRKREQHPVAAEIDPLEPRVLMSVGAPTGVTAGPDGSGAIVVSWNDVADETGYAVEASANGSTNWELLNSDTLPANTVSFSDTRPEAGLGWYRVRALASDETSATSVAVQASIPQAAPVTRIQLQAESFGDGIKLEWSQLDIGSGITIDRKPADTTGTWTNLLAPQLTLPITQTEFDDFTAQLGHAYEYRVGLSSGSSGPTYIYAGNYKTAVHDRGTALIVYDQTLTDSTGDSLQGDISQFASDLIGEGYHVVTRAAPRADVPRTAPANTNPDTIAELFAPWKSAVKTTKDTIRAVWQSYPDLTNVILIGGVAVPYSGTVGVDGHDNHQGAWPADAYYATLSTPESFWTDDATKTVSGGLPLKPANANYPGDGKFDNNTLFRVPANGIPGARAPADVAIGRIDFARMSQFGASEDVGAQPNDSEVAALRTYLQKNHQYRTGQWDVHRQALTAVNPLFSTYGFDRSINLSTNVGIANVHPGEPSSEDPQNPSAHDLNDDTWMWSYIFGPGARGDDYDYLYLRGYGASSDDRKFTPFDYSSSLTGKHQSVFNLIFGSYLADWDYQNSLLRSSIAEPDGFGLAAMWGSFPYWHVHRMGLGDTIGTALLMTQNNFTVYGGPADYTSDGNQGGTYVALMGDPTLREDIVSPVSNVAATSDPGGNIVTWQASPEVGVDGYYIYRATDPNGPWVRLNASATSASATSYTDTGATDAAPYYYMVRAEKLEATPSGAYYNLSTGKIAGAAQPVLQSELFKWDGNVPTQSNPWKQWIDLSFSQSLFLAQPQLALAGQYFDGSTLTPKTLQYGVDFRLVDDPADHTRRIAFLDPNQPGKAGFAPNGVWTLTVSAATANFAGATLGSDQTFSFTFLIADANNDHAVDFNDLTIMSQNYNTPTPDPSAPRVWGDFNCDGVIDFNDLVLLAQLYNTSIFA